MLTKEQIETLAKKLDALNRTKILHSDAYSELEEYFKWVTAANGITYCDIPLETRALDLLKEQSLHDAFPNLIL